ncbi:sulfotransferase [Parvularcula sp. LCG005]|uniref:sulfotransferase family protein n=1 Tax=Parvularcula sp. LCG005 TaxID=3078805 RepID=UPI00294357EF|nr:sulfotransferase [Parvularcula sp. LCG005]WOI53152.1 sulfotransferase [Parvularcula sp. LCG005]
MRLPDLVLIGSPKAGTTSLCDALGQHAGLWMVPGKETQYFSHHLHNGLDWYASLFADAPADKLVAEGTPDYTEGLRSRTIAPMLHDAMPEARLIYMVREPLSRIQSHYVQDIENARGAFIPFSDAVRQRPHLVETSAYWARISDYLSVFRRDQIHVVFLSDFLAHEEACLQGCFEFLGLPMQEAVQARHLNARTEKRRDTKLMEKLRRNPLFDTAKALMPRGLIEKAKPLLRKKVGNEVDAKWDPALRDEVLLRLRDDNRRFLTEFGKPADFWDRIREEAA